ncbi:MAG: hypothetical protein GY859_11115, partial [Desulfobacterales bacterium]|nr:hypothetical protein [Desulfobacterales bacterium]
MKPENVIIETRQRQTPSGDPLARAIRSGAPNTTDFKAFPGPPLRAGEANPEPGTLPLGP